jgi:hypothetical protein
VFMTRFKGVTEPSNVILAVLFEYTLTKNRKRKK